MADYLKGNFKIAQKKDLSNSINDQYDETKILEKEFEKKALEKLGGSIAFVVKPTLVWKGEDASKTS